MRKESVGVLAFAVPGVLHLVGYGEIAPYVFALMMTYFLALLVDEQVDRVNKRIDDL